MTGQLLVMGAQGHTTTEWDTDKPETISDVERKFNEIIGQGGFAFTEVEGQNEQIRTLDPFTQSKVIIAPGMAGG